MCFFDKDIWGVTLAKARNFVLIFLHILSSWILKLIMAKNNDE